MGVLDIDSTDYLKSTTWIILYDNDKFQDNTELIWSIRDSMGQFGCGSAKDLDYYFCIGVSRRQKLKN